LSRKQVLLVLAAILLAGSALRFVGLEAQSLWNDELSSWSKSDCEELSTVFDRLRTDCHPPGFQILQYLVIKYIGDSELALRFHSAIFGALSILLIFFLGVQLYSHREGLIAAALTAFLWFPIFYSQEARAYSALLMFTLLATIFWITLLRSQAGAGKFSLAPTAGYVISGAISAYLHYFGLYLIALQGLALLLAVIKKPRSVAIVAATYTALALAYLPWIPSMVEQMSAGGGTWIPAPTLAFPSEYLRHLFNKSGMFLTIVLLLYLFPLGRRLYLARKTGKFGKIEFSLSSPGWLLALWLIVPLSIAFIVSVTLRPLLTFRNLIISLPAAYLLLARVIATLPVRRIFQSAAAVLLVVFSLIDLFFVMQYYTRPHKEQFREAVEIVIQNDHRYANSLIVGFSFNRNYFDYYFERGDSRRRIDMIAGRKTDISEVENRILRDTPRFVWFLRAKRVPDEEFIGYLKDNLRLVGHHKLVGADVWLFRNDRRGS
jgi:uncharacterized membrane protein